MNEISLPTQSQNKYYTREEIRSIEYNEILSGKNELTLMQNAGFGISEYVKSLNPKYVTVLCGTGNNGGDGIVAAGELSSYCEVKLILLGQPKTESSKSMLLKYSNSIRSISYIDTLNIDNLFLELNTADCIIDAIFGIGLEVIPREPHLSILNLYSKLNNNKIISIDIPSGLDANTGEWYCNSYIPHSILTMQYFKAGLKDLKNLCEIKVIDIGIDRNSEIFVGPGHVHNFLPKRDINSYKGINGRLMVIGGSDEFTGAPVLSGMAALRSGIDTLRIAVPSTIRDIVASYAMDFIVVKVEGERLTIKEFKKYRDLTTHRHDVVAIGMGMSNHPECYKFARDLFRHIKDKLKVVLDADAIRAFKGYLDDIRGSGVIITPHKAELRTILDEKIPSDFDDLVQFLQQKALDLNIIILLKGRIDIITDGERTILNRTGHMGMTVGGTGDVLAGLTAGINCFIEDKFWATAVASYIMGKAGELAAKKFGNSLLASDVINEISNVLLEFI
ncbi:MAG: NAD(P)H-hydrate dehydratase [Candidatus Heimdallarchaeota archaeon]|nr:NAD(P)H-hydrate dehydratase [Candidatus Heimdallarchaeota archaeon]MDH5645900.1 NAD(P)H-hydrate dehydratase [Candidatus Heimdallarchaeota archaeon]